jgi:hypothetical protein
MLNVNTQIQQRHGTREKGFGNIPILLFCLEENMTFPLPELMLPVRRPVNDLPY